MTLLSECGTNQTEYRTEYQHLNICGKHGYRSHHLSSTEVYSPFLSCHEIIHPK